MVGGSKMKLMAFGFMLENIESTGEEGHVIQDKTPQKANMALKIAHIQTSLESISGQKEGVVLHH